MNFYDSWTDFVRYPGTPQKIRSSKDRTDTANAMKVNEDNVRHYFDKEIVPGFIITEREILFREGDEFECTYISDHGQVYIWTRFSVWTLLPEEGDKPVFLERYPNADPEFRKMREPFKYYDEGKWRDFTILSLPPEIYSGLAEVRFENKGSVRASGDMIRQLTFSTYPLPKNHEDFIARFMKPDMPARLLITESEFIDEGDRLETMIIDSVSAPLIWTEKHTCVLRSHEGFERFIVLPRHPDVVRDAGK